MSLAVASPQFGFGYRPQVPGGLRFSDEQTILFAAGNQIARLNLEQKTMKFVPGSETCQKITSVALSPNNRYLAVSEKTHDDKAQIIIYDLMTDTPKKRKVLTSPEASTSEFVSVAFSPDSKYLAAQATAPDWTLFLWTWEKNKLLTSTKNTGCNPVAQNAASVTQVTFSPHDNTLMAVSGKNMLKQVKFHEGQLKQQAFHKVQPQAFTSHTWLSEDRVVIGNESGQVHILDGGELKQTLTLGEHAVGAVCGYNRGLIASCGGHLVIYECLDNHWKVAKKLQTPLVSEASKNGECIVQITVCPTDDTYVVGTDTKQLFTGSLSNVTAIGEESDVLEYISGGFHSGPITGLSVAVRKPLVATSSLDKTVRIWNYLTNQLEYWKDFSEEVFTVSIHPNGHQILAGFGDKLRLLNILIDDFRVVKEFQIWGCKEASFSHGGHYFAAVHGNIIKIFSSVTFEQVSAMKGHNGRVRSVVWSADDQKIISCGTDGAVYEWEVATGARVHEQVLKGTQYTAAVFSPNGKSYASASDGTLREIQEGQVLRTVDLPASINGCALSRSGKLLLCALGGNEEGTCGSVVGVRLPLFSPPSIVVTPGHDAPITRIQMNQEENMLFTAGDDGLVMVWSVADREGRVKPSNEAPIFYEEVLVTRADMEEKMALTDELRTRVEELKMENEYQLRLKDLNYTEKIKELTEKFIQEMESLKSKNQILRVEKEKEIARFDEQTRLSEEKFSQEKSDQEASANSKLMQEYEKYQELLNQKHKMEEMFLRKERELQMQHDQAIHELEEDYEARLAERSRDLEKKEGEHRQAQREHKEEIRQIENDVDQEVLSLKDKYETRLKEEFDSNLKLKGETGILKKKFSNLQKEIEQGQEDYKSIQTDNAKLEAFIASLQKDIAGLKHEITERDETIQEKEKKIIELKKKCQELEKYKFVLDYKIKELKKQIEPRENDIRQQQEQIHEMESELERFNKSNTNLELELSELKQKLSASNIELQEERLRVKDCRTLNSRILAGLHEAVDSLQEPAKMRSIVKTMYEKYGRFAVGQPSKKKGQKIGQDLDAEVELVRQREYLEKNLKSIREKLKRDHELHRQENLKVLQDNNVLLQEINVLRRELKISRADTSKLETKLKLLKRREKKVDEPDTVEPALLEKEKTIELQQSEIARLSAETSKLRKELDRRPTSGSRLPPME